MHPLRGASLLFVLAGLLSGTRAAAASPADSISAPALRGHVYFLASDALGGRSMGSRGLEVATQYAESQFRAAGLEPVPGQDGSAGYLQDVPVVRRTAASPLTVRLRTPRGERTFPEGENVKWFKGEASPLEGRQVPVVFAGYGIGEPGLGWDDFANVDVKDKVVVLMMGAPTRDGKSVLPEAAHALYAPASAVFRKMTALCERRAAAMIVLPNSQITEAWDQLPSATRGPVYELDDRAPGALHVCTLMLAQPEFASALFAGQARVPPGSGARGRTTTRAFELKGVTLGLEGGFTSEPVPCRNVVAMVPGADPALRNECVAVTAHLDTSTPEAEGEVYNGADDDASGVAAVLEIAKAVAAHPPARSVVFALFAGEEAAIVGARHFVAHPPVPLEHIVADVNLDMIGRTDPASQADRAHYAIDSDRVAPAYTSFIQKVNARTLRWPLKYQSVTGNSDDLAFIFMGVPAVSFYSGHHEDVNRPTDDPEKLDYEKMEKIARLACEVTLALGTGTLPWR